MAFAPIFAYNEVNLPGGFYMNDKLTYELSDKEYKEFIHWFHGTYVKMRKARPGRNDFSCLKEPVEMTVKEEIIHARFPPPAGR